MPFQAPGNRAFGTLSAAITAGGLSLVLSSGQGARFDAITAGDYYYLILVDTQETDLDDNWEIVKCTARSSDTFTIERGFEGTFGKAFPRTFGNTVTRVRVWAPFSELQMRMFMTGGGAVVSAAMPTLTVDSPELVLLTPTAAGNCDLPTTHVFAGERFEIHNLSADTADVVTVRSSGANTICLLQAGQSVVLRAVQDAPTTAAHWEPEGSYIHADSWFVHSGTGFRIKPMGAIDAQTTQDVGVTVNSALHNYTLPAGTMSEDGAVLEVIGIFSDGSVTAFDWGALNDDDLDLVLQTGVTIDAMNAVFIVRTGSASAKLFGIAAGPRDLNGAAYTDFLLSATNSFNSSIYFGFNGDATQEIMTTCLFS